MGITKTHVVFIALTLVLVSPPAQASFIQVVMTVLNFINTNMAGYTGVMESLGQGANSQVNSDKQGAEVVVGSLAEQTKTLGGLNYKLNFGSFGTLAGININGVAPGGCLGKKRQSTHKMFLDMKDDTSNEIFPSVNEYAGVHESFDYDEDVAERKVVNNLMKEYDFPLAGLVPNENITEAQRGLWSKYVQFFTVPSPITISGVGKVGSVDEKSIQAARYQAMVGILQKTMLDYGDRYTKVDDDVMSRADVLESYRIYANSDKRVQATNLKTSAGVERELAEAQSMIIDVNSELVNSQDSINGLLTILAVTSTDEVADEL